MTDKRLELRKHFTEKENQKKSDDLFDLRTKQISNLQGTMIDVIEHLVKFMSGNVSKTEVINQLESIATPDIDKVVTAVNKLDSSTTANKLDLKPLEKLLTGIKGEISTIPKKLPEFKQNKDIKVTNLKEVKLDTSPIEKAIKALKLDVNVESPKVNVEKPDLEPMRKLMLDLVKAVNNQKPVVIPDFPEIPETDLKNVEKGIKEANKHLKEIVEKPVGGGGGGGGNGTPYVNDSGTPVNVTVEHGAVPVYAGGGSITSISYDGNGRVETVTYLKNGIPETVTISRNANFSIADANVT